MQIFEINIFLVSNHNKSTRKTFYKLCLQRMKMFFAKRSIKIIKKQKFENYSIKLINYLI